MSDQPDFDTLVNPRQRQHAYESAEDASGSPVYGAIAQDEVATILEHVAARIRRTVGAGTSVRVRLHIHRLRAVNVQGYGRHDGQGR